MADLKIGRYRGWIRGFGNCGEDALVLESVFGMIPMFLHWGAEQRHAPSGTQPSPKS